MKEIAAFIKAAISVTKTAFWLKGRHDEKSAQQTISQTVPYPEKISREVPEEKAEQKPPEIADRQYKERNDLEEFTVPEGVTRIGKWAFLGCSCLERVKLPSTLREIDTGAFQKCASLKEIIIPEGVTKLGGAVFEECHALERAVLPKSLNGMEFENGMFSECTALESVTLPDTLTGDFFNVFDSCKLLTSMDIPKGVTAIGSFTFQDCCMLERVSIPDTVELIEHMAFVGCTSLREVYIPDSVKQIDAFDTFRGCTALEKIRLPVGLTFRKSFDFDEGLGTCFSDCDSLRTVVLGDRSFEITDTLDLAAYNYMHGFLAAEREESVLDYIGQNIGGVLEAVIMNNDAYAMRGLLDFVPQSSIPKDEIQKALKTAGTMNVPELVELLTSYAGRRGISCVKN